MKRILFSAGIVALATSCSQELETLSMEQNNANGITFVAQSENQASRGHFEEGQDGEFTFYEPFWWAEKDQIKIFSTGTNINNGSTWVVTNITAQGASGEGKTYKATKSERSGQFTAVNDDNLLEFKDATTTAQFLAIYPANLIVSSSVAGKYVVTLPNLSAQVQTNTTGNGVYENLVKYSYSTAKKENEYDAVGEKVNLNFQRLLSGIVFKTANADKYLTGENPAFGKLVSVVATIKGEYNSTNGSYNGQTAASTEYLIPATAGATATLKMPTAADGKVSTEMDWGTGAVTSTVNFDPDVTEKNSFEGVEWNDDARAYMITKPLQLANATEDKNLEVVYTFENISFTKVYPLSKKNWEAGKFYQTPALDINEYNYLLTNESNPDGDTNDRTLIVNKGKFADVFKDADNINWEGSTAITKVGTIVVASGVEMTENDIKGLIKFTNLKKIEIADATKIPSGAFVTGLTHINLPKVTEIADDFASGYLNDLEELSLPSYKFESDAVNAKLFTGTNKRKLKKLNISGVESMSPIFGIERTLSFSGYSVLEEVTVKDGVKVSPNAFSSCAKLAKVNGVVDMTNGTAAFKDCGDLKSININGTVIPAEAFSGCTKLTNVLEDGAQVKPTKIGESAFVNVGSASTKPFYMDLSNATEIGQQAFSGSKLVSDNKDSDILTVGATTIKESTFNNTLVKMVKFTNATGIEDAILDNTANLVQVKFVKPFTYVAPALADNTKIFGDRLSLIVLFVSPEQTNWSGTTLKLKGTANGQPEKSFTFKAITVE